MVTDAALTASWEAARRLFAASAGEKVVKGTTEQTDDGIEFLILDCHVTGKIAFDAQPPLIVALTLPAGEGNTCATRSRCRAVRVWT
jgi:hypothetical protein